MIYVPKALFEHMTDKQRGVIVNLITELRQTINIKNLYNAPCKDLRLTTSTGHCYINSDLTLIPTSVCNSKVLEYIIDQAVAAEGNEEELRTLRSLKSCVDGIKKHFKE